MMTAIRRLGIARRGVALEVADGTAANRSFPADGAKHGRATGHSRNRQMRDEGKADSPLPARHRQHGQGGARGVPVMVARVNPSKQGFAVSHRKPLSETALRRDWQ